MRLLVIIQLHIVKLSTAWLLSHISAKIVVKPVKSPQQNSCKYIANILRALNFLNSARAVKCIDVCSMQSPLRRAFSNVLNRYLANFRVQTSVMGFQEGVVVKQGGKKMGRQLCLMCLRNVLSAAAFDLRLSLLWGPEGQKDKA